MPQMHVDESPPSGKKSSPLQRALEFAKKHSPTKAELIDSMRAMRKLLGDVSRKQDESARKQDESARKQDESARKQERDARDHTAQLKTVALDLNSGFAAASQQVREGFSAQESHLTKQDAQATEMLEQLELLSEQNDELAERQLKDAEEVLLARKLAREQKKTAAAEQAAIKKLVMSAAVHSLQAKEAGVANAAALTELQQTVATSAADVTLAVQTSAAALGEVVATSAETVHHCYPTR